MSEVDPEGEIANGFDSNELFDELSLYFRALRTPVEIVSARTRIGYGLCLDMYKLKVDSAEAYHAYTRIGSNKIKADGRTRVLILTDEKTGQILIQPA